MWILIMELHHFPANNDIKTAKHAVQLEAQVAQLVEMQMRQPQQIQVLVYAMLRILTQIQEVLCFAIPVGQTVQPVKMA